MQLTAVIRSASAPGCVCEPKAVAATGPVTAARVIPVVALE